MKHAKICVLGEIAVGKTSLIRRYVDRTFSETYLTTVGVTISRKSLSLAAPSGEGSAEIQIVFWDLEGGQNFKMISSSYRRGAHAAIIVGDLTRPGTIETIEEHIVQFRHTNPASIVGVALNKADLLPGQARTPPKHWMSGGESIQAHFTSAKTGEGVDELITNIGARILEGMQSEPPR